jgi:hypothetical protein
VKVEAHYPTGIASAPRTRRGLYNRLKHINITYYYIRNLKKYRRIHIEYINTDEIIIYNLIKPFIKFILKSYIYLLDLYITSFSL